MQFFDQFGNMVPHTPGTQIHWRPTARVLVIDENERLLCVKARTHKRWVIPGGAIELGESPLEAGAREVLEETGFNIEFANDQPIDFGSNFFFDEVFYQTLWMYFVAKPISLAAQIPVDAEIEEVKWLSRAELEPHGLAKMFDRFDKASRLISLLP